MISHGIALLLINQLYFEGTLIYPGPLYGMIEIHFLDPTNRLSRETLYQLYNFHRLP